METVTDLRRARFEAIVDEVWEPLQRYVLRRVPADAADDVVADTLMTVWRRLDDVPAEAIVPWCFGVARNHVANSRRGQQRRLRLVERIGRVDPPVPFVVSEDADPDIARALASLGDADREVILLSVWDGLGPSEIATVIGATPNAVSVRLHRARAKLAEILGPPRKIDDRTGQVPVEEQEDRT